MARAGWSASKFSASKLNHSFSTSGPSAISQPMPMKMSLTRSCSRASGCRAPGAVPRRQRGDVDRLRLELRGRLGLDDLGLACGERLR